MEAPKEEEFVSSLNVASAPSHTEFEARQALAQQFERPTIKQLERHAEKFGVNMVVQTAAEAGYGLETLIRLQDFCDRVEAAEYRKEHPHARPMKFPDTEKRVKKIIDWQEEEAEEVAA